MLCEFVRAIERAVLSDCFHHLSFLSLADDINATLGALLRETTRIWLDFYENHAFL